MSSLTPMTSHVTSSGSAKCGYKLNNKITQETVSIAILEMSSDDEQEYWKLQRGLLSRTHRSNPYPK